MNLTFLDRSDRRTIELIIERHPDIQDDLTRVLFGLDKSKQIENLETEVQLLKQEIEDLTNEANNTTNQPK
jgi:archaellum component FlaC